MTAKFLQLRHFRSVKTPLYDFRRIDSAISHKHTLTHLFKIVFVFVRVP